VFTSTETDLPLCTPQPLTDTAVGFPPAHQNAHVLPNNL
jgi:hypothetical protein